MALQGSRAFSAGRGDFTVAPPLSHVLVLVSQALHSLLASSKNTVLPSVLMRLFCERPDVSPSLCPIYLCFCASPALRLRPCRAPCLLQLGARVSEHVPVARPVPPAASPRAPHLRR